MTKLKDVNRAIQEIIGLSREQFAQVCMISQGDFRRLLEADTETRKKIFKDIFGTGLYSDLQTRLKDEVSALDGQMTEARRSIRQYTEGMVCADNSDFNAQVQKAKTDGLPTAELTELFENLLSEDKTLETKLDEQVSAAEDAIKALEKQKEAVEAYRQTKENLDKLSKTEQTQTAAWETAKAALEAAKTEKDKTQPELTEHLGKLRNQLPSYDELDEKNKALQDKEKLLKIEQQKRDEAEKQKAIVDHINATERSVNTLSGGEAFLASLALALGLSDEVQMSTGIHLDTLFVDEGFGSLDSEALSKAYQTLTGLTEGNRLVDIISHVAELKERIDRQIVVTKDPDGSSHAELIV